MNRLAQPFGRYHGVIGPTRVGMNRGWHIIKAVAEDIGPTRVGMNRQTIFASCNFRHIGPTRVGMNRKGSTGKSLDIALAPRVWG